MENQTNRPIILSITCIIAWLGALTSLIYFPKVIPAPALYLSLLFVLIAAIGILGIWKMKKWGLYLYLITIVVGSIYGTISILTLLFPLLILLVGFVNYRKMR